MISAYLSILLLICKLYYFGFSYYIPIFFCFAFFMAYTIDLRLILVGGYMSSDVWSSFLTGTFLSESWLLWSLSMSMLSFSASTIFFGWLIGIAGIARLLEEPVNMFGWLGSVLRADDVGSLRWSTFMESGDSISSPSSWTLNWRILLRLPASFWAILSSKTGFLFVSNYLLVFG